MKRFLFVVTLCAGAAPIAVSAAENSGWYIGGSVGQSTSDYSSSRARSDFGYAAGVNVDNADTGWKLFSGYRFNPNLGIEFGFVDLGVTRLSGRVSGFSSADKL